ncbi:MAG: mandelate racemase [Micromonosporaceae bacterium]|nr:mandelate racemase [Micromonosporaceae bacterium]
MRLSAAAYRVPTPVPEADGTLAWSSTTAVVVHAGAQGQTGLGWSYGPAPAAALVAELLAPALHGADPMDLPGAALSMRVAARNALLPGLVTLAVSAVDVALWDLKARILGVPLHALLGRAHDTVPVYGSGGFTTLTAEQTREQLAGWVHGDGIPRVKIKIAEDHGRAQERDLCRIALARQVVGPQTELYADANGGYTAKQAIRVARRAGEQDLRWLEEPVSSDDLAGLALVRSQVEPDVAAGEYGTGPRYFRRMCQSGAVDCLQVDATRCGGYTGFLAAAAVADTFGLEVSAHCAPQLHAPVCAAVPNLRHLEWFADHVRLERLLLAGCLPVQAGAVRPGPAPGHGLELKEPDARRFRVA